MEVELYKAAMWGSFDAMSRFSNWTEQRTHAQYNNVLHLHVGKPLPKRGFRKGDTEFIEKVLEHDDENEACKLLWQGNSNGDTPLHLAARFGHTNAVEAFLECVNKNNQQVVGVVTRLLKVTNRMKDTALHEAARAGHAHVVKLLVEADPNCSHHHPNEDGETPLYLAAERGSTSSVLSILQTCNGLDNLAYKGPCGRTALHAAVQWGDPAMVSKLVEKDRSLMRIQDNEGITPLHSVAAEVGKVGILKVLLHGDKESSVAYIKDKKGRTPLHIAMLRKNWEAMRILIDYCPDCIEIVDDQAQNVVHYAAKWTCIDVMKQLLRVEHVHKLINDKDKDGNTPLHILAASIPQTPNLHECLNGLPNFVKQNPFLDLKAFNNDNHTVGDMLILFDHVLGRENILRKSATVIARGRRINEYERDVDIEKATLIGFGETRDAKSLKEAAQSRMVVAALIATVSFTAGFTVPGGFDQNAGENMGMAVFKDKPLFKVFLVSDAIAFSTSTVAILFYFVLVLRVKKGAIRALSITAFIFNTISSAALMVAFLAGVSSVVSSKSLTIVIIAISSVFLLVFGLLIRRTINALRRYYRELSGKYIMNLRLLR